MNLDTLNCEDTLVLTAKELICEVIMGSLRRRKTAKKSDSTKEEQSTSSDQAKPPTTEEEEEHWTTVIREHWMFPIFFISVVILTPYCLYVAYLYLVLQRPELLFFLPLRPAVNETDPRQLLIVGTMSSGTSQVAHDLQKQLQLEVGHENADTAWNFVRDGTVSWFHGIRFLDTFANDDEAFNTRRRSFSTICVKHWQAMGFHPSMYRQGTCSTRSKEWSPCWMRECLRVLHREWGCGLREDGCVTPFAVALWQTRHPLRTMESLVTKFCIGGLSGKTQPSFVKFAGALFPQHDFAGMSCVEAAGYYVVEYCHAMLTAMENGAISARYKVEEASPCLIAKLAGFGDPKTAIYPAHTKRLQAICESPNLHSAKEPMLSTKFAVNKGQLTLDWDDLLGDKHGSTRKQGDSKLRDLVKNLCQQLDYQI